MEEPLLAFAGAGLVFLQLHDPRLDIIDLLASIELIIAADGVGVGEATISGRLRIR